MNNIGKIKTLMKARDVTSIVVVFAVTSDICMIKNPKTLNANARFKTADKTTMVLELQMQPVRLEK